MHVLVEYKLLTLILTLQRTKYALYDNKRRLFFPISLTVVVAATHSGFSNFFYEKKNILMKQLKTFDCITVLRSGV